MIKLVIIGNGFDRAHGLRTDYTHFLQYLFDKSISRRDSVIQFNDMKRISKFGHNNKFTFEFFIKNFNECLEFSVCKINNNFLINLFNDIHLKNWVDIEEKYYSILKATPESNIELLNKNFDEIKNELIKYLETIVEDFSKNIVSNNPMERYIDIFKAGNPQKIWFLNFNYTPTIEVYKEQLVEIHKIPSEIINIHGSVFRDNERIIFGYGDEEDNSYFDLVNKNNNEFVKNIKSNLYNKNYVQLKRILSSNMSAYCLGHSMGLSDRTLLRELFTHRNLNTIKLFYYKNQAHYDNLRINVSRIFLQDKSYKTKILDFESSEKMPQIYDSK